jgi:hypothetical protein
MHFRYFYAKRLWRASDLLRASALSRRGGHARESLNRDDSAFNLNAMADQETSAIAPATEPGLEVEQLARPDYFHQVLVGVGISSGLALLWVMETGRNGFFWLLEKLHIPAPKKRHGSAFPPSPQRRR